jgi:hypothetical protein
VQHTANRGINSFLQDGCHSAIKLYNNNVSDVYGKFQIVILSPALLLFMSISKINNNLNFIVSIPAHNTIYSS